MNKYTNEEIGIIVSALKDNKTALDIFLNGLDCKIFDHKVCDKSIINENSISTNDILEINLANLAENEIEKTLEFFYAHDFPKLEKLIMPQYLNIKNLETIVFSLFKKDKINIFVSLNNIIFNGNTTENMFHTIFNHFSLYSNFTRKFHQYSEYYKKNCVYVSIKNIGNLNLDNKIWLKGVTKNNIHSVTYTNGMSEKIPFVIYVSR